ncbi:MAG TPA: hypothetical protein VGP89_18065 [Candidatus Angelobacter sp.]|jgi:hypothetical protein|nr:hypothetical protein [Candidatus Angelobacter sp.]
MSRGDSKKVVNAGLANSATDQANASSAFAGTNKAVGDYSNRLNTFINANPYKAGGEFAQDQSQIAASAADTSSSAIKDKLARDAQTSGENTGGYANNVAEAQRQATRDQATHMAGADATRISAKSAYDKAGLDASALPADLQARLYGTSIQGRNGALGTAGDSAKQPSFLDSLMPALIGAGAQVGAGFTPHG